jgi:DDE superfamily endonuclease
MPRMGRFPPFGKRFFRRARKLLGSCHMEHFWRVVIVLASLQEGRSLSRIEDATNDRRSRQAISNFLTLADWDAPQVLGQTALDQLGRLGLGPGDTLYLVLDDTQKRKRGKLMAAVSKIFLHAEKVYAHGHTILGAAWVFRGVVLPCAVKLWASRDSCRKSGSEPDPIDRLDFRTLTGMAADVVADLPVPQGVRPIVLFDSYYLCHEVAQACDQRGWKYVGVAKKNRNFFPDGRPRDRRKLGVYGREVLRRDGRPVKVRAKKYRLAERVGHLKHLGRVKLVLSRRPRDAAWVCLVTNETRWSKSTVLSHYLRRWGIEVFFKASKQNLGLGDYHLLRYRGIERYLCLVLIAYLLLTHLALDAPDAKAQLKKRADLRLPSVPQRQQNLRRHLWNHVLDGLAKNKTTRLAAKKLREAIQL